MKPLLLAGLLLAAGLCQTQTLEAPRGFGPASAKPGASLDPPETPMMALPSNAGTFGEWYQLQRRPALVLYFDKRLDQLPPGWQGGSRLLIEREGKSGKQQDSQRLTVGVQHNTETASAMRGDFATLFEQALQQEMKRQQLRLLDGVVLQRKLSSAGRAEGADVEYASLNKAARLIFEVQLVCLSGGCELLGTVKDIHSGGVPASVRWPIDATLDRGDNIERASRALVQQLMKQKVS
jgi:hypothetical protein